MYKLQNFALEESKGSEEYKADIDKISGMAKDISEPQTDLSNERGFFSNAQLGSSETQSPIANSVEPLMRYSNSFFSSPTCQDTLTNRVWPKSRILLAIASRMYKEKVINLETRGKLKDLIIVSDPRLEAALKDYYINGDRTQLYRNLISLT